MGDIELDELLQLASEGVLGAGDGKKRTRGGAHAKLDKWTAAEMKHLMNMLPRYKVPGGHAWTRLTEDHFPTRTVKSVRGCKQRMEKATHEREAGGADDGKKKNRCRKCNQIKKGHLCPFDDPGTRDYVETALTCLPVAAARPPAGGASAGASRAAAGSRAAAPAAGGGGLARFKAAGLKTVAIARFAKAGQSFLGIRVTEVFDSILQGTHG